MRGMVPSVAISGLSTSGALLHAESGLVLVRRYELTDLPEMTWEKPRGRVRGQ